jgi:hypothetical protein
METGGGKAVYILVLRESVAATGRRFSGAQSSEIGMDHGKKFTMENNLYQVLLREVIQLTSFRFLH